MIAHPIARVTLALAASLLAATAFARADDKIEARHHFSAGVERAKTGDYQQAIAEFQRAYELSPNYAVLYNIGEMHRALGDAAAALDTFQRYLLDGGAAVPGARRAKVVAAIEAERAKTASLAIRVTRAPAQRGPVRVLVDGKIVGATGDGAAIRVNPGKHAIAATADGEEDDGGGRDSGRAAAEQEITVAAGETADVTLTLTPAKAPDTNAPPPTETPPPPAEPLPSGTAAAQPAPAANMPAPPTATATPPPAAPAPAPSGRPDAPAAPSHVRRNLGYAVAGVGIGGLAVAAVSYSLAQSRWHHAVDDGCTAASCTGAALAEYDGAGRALTVFNVSVIAGGALLAGGMILLLTAPSESAVPRAPPKFAISPAIAPGGGGLTMISRW